MFGNEKKKNKYSSYPKCPSCDRKGPLISEGNRQCLNDVCEVELYWVGGVTKEARVPESELHEAKEEVMEDALERFKDKE